MAAPPDWCKPGVRVVCIHPDRHFLVKGKTYTIHETLATPHPLPSDALVGLREVMRELQLFGLWRFRGPETKKAPQP